jgi:hypothetical protein
MFLRPVQLVSKLHRIEPTQCIKRLFNGCSPLMKEE